MSNPGHGESENEHSNSSTRTAGDGRQDGTLQTPGVARKSPVLDVDPMTVRSEMEDLFVKLVEATPSSAAVAAEGREHKNNRGGDGSNDDVVLTREQLEKALRELKIPHCPHKLNHLFKMTTDVEEDGTETTRQAGKVTKEEFLKAMMEHDKKLRDFFSDADINADGKLALVEVTIAFDKIGVELSDKDAADLAKKMRTFRGEEVLMTFEEWRDLLLFHSLEKDLSGRKEEGLCFWNNWSRVVDLGMGEMSNPPDYMMREVIEEEDWWTHLGMAVLSGGITRTFTAPLTRTKVCFQVYPSQAKMGIVACFMDQVGEGRLRSLWRGNMMNSLRIAPEMFVKFHAFNWTHRSLHVSNSKHQSSTDNNNADGVHPTKNDDEATAALTLTGEDRGMAAFHRQVGPSGGKLLPMDHVLDASLSSIVTHAVVYPFEVLSTRGTLRRTGHYYGYIDAIYQISRKEGYFTFYRGFLANMAAVVPFSLLETVTFDFLKEMHLKRGAKDVSHEDMMKIGAVSTAVGIIAVYPLLHIRTILQTRGLQGTFGHDLSLKLGRKPGVTDVARALSSSGPKALYRGLIPCLLKIYPVAAVSYMFYEASNKLRISWRRWNQPAPLPSEKEEPPSSPTSTF